jgi:hypothetical protein
MKIYPYQTSEGLIDLVPIEYVNELNERLQERTRDYLRTMEELRAENFRLKNASQTAVLYHKQSLASEDRATENLRKLEKAEAELAELEKAKKLIRSVADRALDYIDLVVKVFQSCADDRRFSIMDRVKMGQCAREIASAAKPLHAELAAFDALQVTPNPADCGQSADTDSEFEDFERASATAKPLTVQ